MVSIDRYEVCSRAGSELFFFLMKVSCLDLTKLVLGGSIKTLYVPVGFPVQEPVIPSGIPFLLWIPHS
jgi:hypothetical protein